MRRFCDGGSDKGCPCNDVFVTLGNVRISLSTRRALLAATLTCAAMMTIAGAFAEEQKAFMAGRQLPAGQMQITSGNANFDVPPKFVRGEAPTYPIRQLRYGGGGYAVIGFVIDESGRT